MLFALKATLGKNRRTCFLLYSSQPACNQTRPAVTRLAPLIRNVNINAIFFTSFAKSLVIYCNQFGIKIICCVGWKNIILRMGSSDPTIVVEGDPAPLVGEGLMNLSYYYK